MQSLSDIRDCYLLMIWIQGSLHRSPPPMLAIQELQITTSSRCISSIDLCNRINAPSQWTRCVATGSCSVGPFVVVSVIAG
jgi:hypothetical protein